MKQLFTLIVLLALALPASGQTIKRQFGTTNDPTTLTNIILGIAGQVGGATNGIEKLNGFGTNTTLRTPTFITPTFPDLEVITIGDWLLVPTATTLDFLESAGSTSVLKLNGDNVEIQEKLTVSEEVIVTTGQEGPAITQSGGGTNFFDASTRFDSNVFARTFVADVGITNNGLTASRPIFTDANKGLVSTTIDLIPGSNVTITTNVANRAWTIASTGGSGSGSNGLSYVLTPGGEWLPAIRVRNEGVSGAPIAEWLHTNSVPFIGLTNNGDGSSGWAIKDDTGFEVLKSSSIGTGSAYLGGGGVLGLYLGATPLALWDSGGQLRINDLTGATALDHTDKDAPILGPYTFDLANWEDGGTVYRDGTVIRASNTIPTMNVGQANIGNIYVTNRLTVTNSIRQPFFELISTGNATNFTADWAATVPDNNTINATGNVYFAVIAANLVGGVTKQFVITNVFKASSNITAYVQTNLLHLNGQTYTVGASPMHTNYAIPVTNIVVLNLQSIGTTPQSIMSFFVHDQP